MNFRQSISVIHRHVQGTASHGWTIRNSPGLQLIPDHELKAWSGRRGFTMVELMVVMAILMILAGMLMPLIGQARRSSMRTQTLSIMAKTESALHQYKSDFRGYPYQITYADVANGESWTNTLNYQLGTAITPIDAANIRADMQAASADYDYILTNYIHGWGNQRPILGSVHAFIDNRHDGISAFDQAGNEDSDLVPVGAWQPNYSLGNLTYFLQYNTASNSLTVYGNNLAIPCCVLLNRIAGERASDLMMIGAIHATGVKMNAVTYQGMTHPGKDLSNIPLVASPASAKRPGWANDYLQGEVDSAHISGSAILDAWSRPLIYVGQVLPGCETCCGEILGQSVDISNTAAYGLAPMGRNTLEPDMPGSSNPVVTDAYLPDSSQLLHSDRRYWAAPGYELEFELWSAGPDRHFSWWRDDSSNSDNVSCEPYDKTIGTQP